MQQPLEQLCNALREAGVPYSSARQLVRELRDHHDDALCNGEPGLQPHEIDAVRVAYLQRCKRRALIRAYPVFVACAFSLIGVPLTSLVFVGSAEWSGLAIGEHWSSAQANGWLGASVVAVLCSLCLWSARRQRVSRSWTTVVCLAIALTSTLGLVRLEVASGAGRDMLVVSLGLLEALLLLAQVCAFHWLSRSRRSSPNKLSS